MANDHDEATQFEAALWRYQGKGAWYFLTLPSDLALKVRLWGSSLSGFGRSGFRPIKVQVTINDQIFDTALFADKESKSYLLPIKKSVRTALGLSEADVICAPIRPLY